MATRNSVARQIPGSPLASILRETARQARRTSRRGGADGATGPEGPQGEAADPATLILGHALIATDGGGNGMWTYPVPNPMGPPTIPIVQASVGVNASVAVTLVTVTDTFCTFKTWNTVTGGTVGGIYVFLSAFPSPFIP